MENYILIAIVLGIVLYYSLKIKKLYAPKKTLSCMEVADVKKALSEKKDIVLIDIRTDEEREDFVLPEAVYIPIEKIGKNISKFDKKTTIVITCAKGGQRSVDTAILFAKKGYNAHWLCGGMDAWIDSTKKILSLK